MNRPQYIDIHAHVNFPDFDADRDVVLQRAKDAGVFMINVGTNLETSRSAVEFAEKHEGVYAIIGLHPISTTEESFDEAAFAELVKHPKVVGIGECGIDLFHIPGLENTGSPEYKDALAKQEKVFRAQIEFAIAHKKPIMIHARQSYKNILEIIDEYFISHGPLLTGNVHFFAGTIEEAQAFLDKGFTVSFTGVITFAKQYEELVKYLPLDRIMSETDCPFVAPVPYRGKRNEPAFVVEVVKKIAEIKGQDLETVKKTLVDNAFRLFSL